MSTNKLNQKEMIKFKIEYIPKKIFNKTHFTDTYKKEFNALNKAKDFIGTLKKEKYHYYMKTMDTYFNLKKTILKEYGGLAVSNAWLKMYEMFDYAVKPMIEEKVKKDVKKQQLTMFGACELPGAFVSATNHYLNNHFPQVKLDWNSESYYPETGKTFLEDHYGIYEYNRERWLMGPKPNGFTDDIVINGDITDVKNLQIIATEISIKFGGVELYTADAGIDVSSDYNNGESMTLKINFGQVLAGLMTMREGGILITKQFSIFTLFNRSLINILSTCFREFYIIKPLTSRPTNSEIYLCGIGYLKNAPVKMLIDIFDKCEPDLNLMELFECDDKIDDKIDDKFYSKSDSINDALLSMTTIQIRYLEELKEFIQSFEKLKPSIEKFNEIKCKEWLTKMGVKRIDKKNQIASN